MAAREARRGVLRACGCCVPLLLLCGAYVLRCVCEGLLSMARRLSKPCIQTATGSGEEAGTATPRRIPHTTTRPFEAHHTSSACLCVVAVTRTTRWPSASGCSRHTQIPYILQIPIFSKFLSTPSKSKNTKTDRWIRSRHHSVAIHLSVVYDMYK